MYTCVSRVYARFKRVPIPFRGAALPIRLRALDHAVYFRLGSTDLPVVHEIFKSYGYDFVIDKLKGSPPKTIVDLGSNAGYSLCFWAKQWPDARQIGVEASGANYAISRKNVRPVASDIAVIHGFVSARDGVAHLDHSRGLWGVQESASEAGEASERITMEKIIEDHLSGGTIDLLKCDIEGAERELFHDSSKWIDRVGSILIEIHEPYTRDEFADRLRASGWTHEVELIEESKGNGWSVLWTSRNA